MTLIGILSTFISLVAVWSFVSLSRVSRNPICKAGSLVWALIMVFTAVRAPIIAFTEYDEIILYASQIVLPLGWATLALMAALYRANSGRL